MTVGELIRHLQGFPKDMPVLVNGYENGFDDPLVPRRLRVKREKGADYDGDYQRELRTMNNGGFEAVVIPRPVGDGDPDYETGGE